MSDQFHDFYLSADTLDISFLKNEIFLQDFNGNILTS